MAIRGIIFDMDGTITAPYLEFAKFERMSGIGKVDALDYLRSATGAEYERVHKLLMKFEEDGVAAAKLNRGARTLLEYLKRRKMPTALLTRNSRKSVDAVLAKLKVKFEIVVTREDGPHKPSPEPIWRIGKAWGLKRSELLMVGDYKWDVLCANNAGIRCACLVERGKELPEWTAKADFIIHRLSALIEIVEASEE